MISSNYTISDWYWTVAGDTRQVFASGRIAYVPVTDATYAAWAEAGNPTTSILDTQELYEVLLQQWLPSKIAAGITVSSTSTPGLNGTYPLDPQNQQYITSISTSIAAGRGLPGGGDTFMFAGHPFDADQFLTFASICQDYVYNLVQSLGQIVMTGNGSLPSSIVTLP